MEFTAVKTFHSPELKSDYVSGLSYTARDPKQPGITPLAAKNRATLQKLLPGWIKEGKVVPGHVAMSPGTMSGAGKVH